MDQITDTQKVGHSHFSERPYRHRVWLPNLFEHLSLETPNADWRVANYVSDVVVGASAYSPRFEEIVRAQKTLEADMFEVKLQKAKAENDHSWMVQAYSEEIERLNKEIARLTEEVEQLSLALSAPQKTIDLDEKQSFIDDEGSLLAVLSKWTKATDSGLLFSESVEEQFKSVNSQACPSEKLDRHFKVLSELAREYKLKSGRLGKTIVQWLKDRNIECSNESETRRGAGLFSFPISGTEFEFELHLKVTDGTAPDRCVRIYFRPSDDRSNIYVGFVGSKKLLL